MLNPPPSISNILRLSADYVKILFQQKLPEWAVYHNLEHTIQTVDTCNDMALYYKLNSKETELLIIAAWFHDTGYIYGPDEHEERSVEIVTRFLQENNFNPGLTQIITDCIRKTKISTHPVTLLQCIIRDADLVSLGALDYFRMDELLRIEFELRQQINIDPADWMYRSEKFLSAHYYHTEYARLKLNLQLEMNLKELSCRLQNSSKLIK